MRHLKNIWVLIADGARSRVFEKSKHDYAPVEGGEMSGNRLRDSEALTDKPGRAFSSAGSSRHDYEPKTSWHDHQKQEFAREISEFINKAFENKEFEHLVIIAPSKTLGELRNFLNKNVQDKVSAEIHKDITKFTDSQIKDFLSNEIDKSR